MNDNQNRIIIFCQAPSDVQYVLSLYEKHKADRKISVFVINVESIYHYFQSLNLNLESLIFIPYPKNVPLLDFTELIKIRKELKNNYNKYFQNLQEQTVYFFSKYFDWLTAYFVSIIVRSNNVFIIDHSGETFSGIKKINGPMIIYRKLLFKYLTSINFSFFKMQSTIMMSFQIENYHIEKKSLELDPFVIKKYKVTTATNKEKSVLLFENNQSAYDFYSDYEHQMTDIVNVLIKYGYKIYLKPHPRQGYSDFLKPSIENILPAEIPGEFFNPDDFSFIAGVDTNSAAFFAKDYQDKTLSLLELFKFKREDEKERFRQTQIKISKGNIHFVPSITELMKIIA